MNIYATLNLPLLPTQASKPRKQKSPKKRGVIVPLENTDCDKDSEEDSDN